jgi:hypothetical protein
VFGVSYLGQPYFGQGAPDGTAAPPNETYGGGPLGGFDEFGYNAVLYAVAGAAAPIPDVVMAPSRAA